MADWDEDGPRLTENLQGVLRDARGHARSRETPTVEFARAWHREIMSGLEVPDPAWVGAFRGEPELVTIGVRVGIHPGVPAGDVRSALRTFESRLRRAIEYLDRQIPPGSLPGTDEFDAVIEVCAWAHSEWVRIHPFANGNGRTARLWANYLAIALWAASIRAFAPASGRSLRRRGCPRHAWRP